MKGATHFIEAYATIGDPRSHYTAPLPISALDKFLYATRNATTLTTVAVFLIKLKDKS